MAEQKQKLKKKLKKKSLPPLFYCMLRKGNLLLVVFCFWHICALNTQMHYGIQFQMN